MAISSVGAGAAVILLASRQALHRAVEFTSESDIKALLRLVLVVFVILPLLPDIGMGRFGALNPFRLWMVVVVIGAISFIGYILARWLGTRRGALITAAVGALVSSTAVTLGPETSHLVRGLAGGVSDHMLFDPPQQSDSGQQHHRQKNELDDPEPLRSSGETGKENEEHPHVVA